MMKTASSEILHVSAASRWFTQLGRGTTIRLLRSRVGRRLGRTLTVITYRGRTSRRMLSTPVEYVRSGSRVTILVASPHRKQWWRNVRALGDVTLLVDGRERAGSATVLTPAEAGDVLAAYLAARPRAAGAAAAGAVAVIVELTDVAT